MDNKYLVPMTELDAVNMAMDLIGEEPVSNLLFTGVSDASTAYRHLINVTRGVQEKGWSFNKETDYPLLVNTDNNIEVPSNVLFIDPVDRSLDLVQRGNRLYDKTNHTYTFTIDKVLVDIVWMLPFEELPSYARSYISIKAARKFQRGILGSGDLEELNATDEGLAWATFLNNELKAGDYNFLGQPDNAYALRRRP